MESIPETAPSPGHPSGTSPPATPNLSNNTYRGVIASSINLVQSYRRSQLFIGDNLPNSFSESSFSTNYLSHRHHRGNHDGIESENGEDDVSYTSFSEQDHEEVDGAETDELSAYDHESLPPSSFLPPNAFGSRRLPSRYSRASQSSFQPYWARHTSSDLRPANSEAGYSPTSPVVNLPGSNHTARASVVRTPTLESSQLISSPEHPFLRYGSISGGSSGRPISRHRDRIGPESISESQTRHHQDSSYCSSNISHAGGRPVPAFGTSTFGQTLFNAFNILCGVGLLSEPLAFSAMGWIGSVILFTFCGLSTNYTAKILARLMAEDHFLLTYNDICFKAFGRSMQYPIAGLFCLELFSLSVALMVIFGDSLATIFPSISADSFKILAFCLVLPTVFMPLQVLSYTSLLGLLSSLTLVSVVVIDGLVKEDAPGSIFHPAKTSLSPSSRWGLSAGLMMSGFSGHSVMPSLAREMRNPQDFNRMVDYAYVAAGSMYLIIGLIGYLMFGDNVSQEITQDILRTPGYPKTINKIAIWMIGINPVAKFALCTRPLNVTIEHLLNLTAIDDMSDPHGPPVPRRKSMSSNRSQQLTPRSTHSDLANSHHEASASGKNKPAMVTKALGVIISRTIVTFLVVVVSILLPNFERVMAFLGVESFVLSFFFSTCTCITAFAAFVICTILPVSAEMILTNGKGRSPTTRIINIILLITAIVMAAIGTTYSFLP